MKIITGILFLSVFAVSGLSVVKDANAAGGASFCVVDYVYTGPPNPAGANCRVVIHHAVGGPALNGSGEAPAVSPDTERQCSDFKERIEDRLLLEYAAQCG